MYVWDEFKHPLVLRQGSCGGWIFTQTRCTHPPTASANHITLPTYPYVCVYIHTSVHRGPLAVAHVFASSLVSRGIKGLKRIPWLLCLTATGLPLSTLMVWKAGNDSLVSPEHIVQEWMSGLAGPGSASPSITFARCFGTCCISEANGSFGRFDEQATQPASFNPSGCKLGCRCACTRPARPFRAPSCTRGTYLHT